jgi:hypothetical protein
LVSVREVGHYEARAAYLDAEPVINRPGGRALVETE